MPDCGVGDPRIKSHCGQLCHHDNLGHRLHALAQVSRLTQPSTLREMAEPVSVIRLHKNNMAMVATCC